MRDLNYSIHPIIKCHMRLQYLYGQFRIMYLPFGFSPFSNSTLDCALYPPLVWRDPSRLVHSANVLSTPIDRRLCIRQLDGEKFQTAGGAASHFACYIPGNSGCVGCNLEIPDYTGRKLETSRFRFSHLGYFQIVADLGRSALFPVVNE
jgi:hypothetical protein